MLSSTISGDDQVLPVHYGRRSPYAFVLAHRIRLHN
jgi:hypothetical protein